MNRRPLLWITGGFVLGEILEIWGMRHEIAIWVFFSVFVLLAAGSIRLCLKRQRITELLRKKSISLKGAGFLLFFVLLGFVRAGWEQYTWQKAQEWTWYEQEYDYYGRIDRLTESEERTEIVLHTEALGNILVYADRQRMGDLALHIGEALRVHGKAEQPEEPRNPGQFDFQSYYRSQKICCRMWAESLEEIDAKVRWWDQIKEILRKISERGGAVLDNLADPGDAGILRAVILGDKTRMDPDIKSMYQRNGISHVLAISALHLSLISMAVYRGLRMTGLGYGSAGMIGGIFLISYSVMSGSSSSVVRASVMALLGYLAAYWGRTYDLLTALSAAAFLILWNSPYQLTQSGVQLSFAAVLGIAVTAPMLKKKGFSQGMAVSLGLQLSMLPLILYHTYQLPIYSVFLNLIVVPLMGIVIASGTTGILLGLRSLTAGRFAIAGSHIILTLYEWLCGLFGKLPGAVIVVGQPDVWKIIVYYGLLFFYLCHNICTEGNVHEKGMAQKKVFVDILLCSGMLLLLCPIPSGKLRVTFLDVGQGDGICIQKGWHTVLVDGGSSSEKKVGEYCLVPYLKSQGIHSIDYAIVSHGDADHINGLEELLQDEPDIRIRNLVLPASGRGDDVYDRLVKKANQKESGIIWMEAGDVLDMKGMRIACLYPEGARSGSDGVYIPITEERNDHSLVLQVDYEDFHMLLTGDMTESGEQRMLELGTYPKGIRVMKMAHHGSSSSSCQEWMEVVHPIWAILSYGRNNRYGHPHEEVTDRLKQLGIETFRTGESGAVWLETDGKSIHFDTFLH